MRFCLARKARCISPIRARAETQSSFCTPPRAPRTAGCSRSASSSRPASGLSPTTAAARVAPPGRLWTASAMWQTCTTYWTASVWTRHTWSPLLAVGRSHWSTASSPPWHLSELSAGYRALHPEGVRRWEAVPAAAPQERGFTVGSGTRTPITSARLAGLTTPLLLLIGAADPLTPPVLMRQLARHLPSTEFRVLDEVGHTAFWKAPPEWDAPALDFLTRHRVRPNRTVPASKRSQRT